MKKIYVAYKFKDSDVIELRNKLEKLSKVIEESTEYKTFIFFRDVQNWGEKKMNIKEIIEKASSSIRDCDALLVESSEKARGPYFELGYAKALGKKTITVHKKGTDAAFLKAASDISIEYGDLEDLRKQLKNKI